EYLKYNERLPINNHLESYFFIQQKEKSRIDHWYIIRGENAISNEKI
ncbi:unnamed protein product, partial [marine sediment metagenome]